MLNDKKSVATVAVKDLKRARKFYEDILGLKPIEGDEATAFSYGTAGGNVLVYQSQYAGTNQATAVTWVVGADLDRIVRDLRAKGVAFEHYDLPGMTRDGDIHTAGPMRVAWFKDPDGNIHALGNR